MRKTFDIETYDVPSFSFLKKLGSDKNPAKLIYERMNPTPKSYAQIEGKALDCIILSPDKFGEKFFVAEKAIDTETTNYKFVRSYLDCCTEGDEHETAIERAKSLTGHRFTVKTLAEYLSGEFTELIRYIQESEGRQSISSDLYDRVNKARDYVMKNSPLPDYLHGAETLKWVEWADSISGVQCRGEIDVCGSGFVLDLKKAVNAQHDTFAGRFGPIAKLDYAVQVVAYAESQRVDPPAQTEEEMVQELEEVEAAFMRTDSKPLVSPFENNVDAFIFAVELSPMPGAWSMHRISNYDYIIAQEKFAQWCRLFKFCKEKNLWNMGYELKFYEWSDNMETFFLRDPRFIQETQLFS